MKKLHIFNLMTIALIFSLFIYLGLNIMSTKIFFDTLFGISFLPFIIPVWYFFISLLVAFKENEMNKKQKTYAWITIIFGVITFALFFLTLNALSSARSDAPDIFGVTAIMAFLGIVLPLLINLIVYFVLAILQTIYYIKLKKENL